MIVVKNMVKEEDVVGDGQYSYPLIYSILESGLLLMWVFLSLK